MCVTKLFINKLHLDLNVLKFTKLCMCNMHCRSSNASLSLLNEITSIRL